jgi:hypothetical protein
MSERDLLKLNKKKLQKTITFGVNAHSLKQISTEDLLQLAYQNVNKNEREGKKSQVKENEMAKNMLKEGKYEFHIREKTLGLPEVPLERPYDGRSNIKGIILDIRSNINKISF